ncbi:MAG: hypothetical protein AB8G05_27040 [Oligoflexales bacterium]
MNILKTFWFIMLLFLNSFAFSNPDDLQERITFLETELERSEVQKKVAFCTNCISSAWNVIKNSKNDSIIKAVLQGVEGCIDSGFLDKRKVKNEAKNMLEYALKNKHSYEVLSLIHSFNNAEKLPLNYLAAAVDSDLDQNFIDKIFDFSVYLILSNKETSTWKEGSFLKRRNGFCYELLLFYCWSNVSPKIYKIKGKKVKTICSACKNKKTFKLPFKNIEIAKRKIEVPNTNLTELFDKNSDKTNKILLSREHIVNFIGAEQNYSLLMIYAVYGNSPKSLAVIYKHSDPHAQNSEGLSAFQLALLYNNNPDMLKAFIELEACNRSGENLVRSFPEDFNLHSGSTRLGSKDPKYFLRLNNQHEIANFIDSKLSQVDDDQINKLSVIGDETKEEQLEKIDMVNYL